MICKPRNDVSNKEKWSVQNRLPHGVFHDHVSGFGAMALIKPKRFEVFLDDFVENLFVGHTEIAINELKRQIEIVAEDIKAQKITYAKMDITENEIHAYQDYQDVKRFSIHFLEHPREDRKGEWFFMEFLTFLLWSNVKKRGSHKRQTILIFVNTFCWQTQFI